MPRLETTDNSLERVLAEIGSAAEVQRREAAMFERLTGGAQRAVVFGCGHLGRIVLSGALRAGVEVVALADNNRALWGTRREDIPIVPPVEAVEQYGSEAYFVVAVYNSSAPIKQLRELGCRHVVPYAAFFWRFGQSMPSAPGIELPHRIVASAHAIRAGYACLSDPKSRTEFASQIAWRCTLDYDRLSPADNAAEIYFAPDLVKLSTDEAFVDCGAFDGDSIRLFRTRTTGRYRSIHACEPDESNRQALERFIASLPEAEQARIAVLPYAVADRNGTIAFESSGTAGSRITTDGSAGSLEARRLDDLMRDVSPTMIKMDIEGAEPDAIRGATETIRSARPRLAICAYHKSEHLWTLPTLIAAALPEYQISLRRYAEECWETVYYAIPPELAGERSSGRGPW